MQSKKDAKRSGRLIQYCMYMVLGALMVAVIGSVAAKYVRQDSSQKVVAAKEFYFSSNLLAEGGTSYILNSNAGAVSFTLGNNADALRFTEDNISYTIESTGGGSLNINQGTLTGGQLSAATIMLSGLERGQTYTVTATGEAGYKQTLSATFTVSENDENIYKYLDTSNGAYVLLTVWADNIKGTVSVSFPSGVIPDNTDPVLKSVYNYENGTYEEGAFTDGANFNGQTYSSYMYRFFRADMGNIDVDDFIVLLEDENAKNHLATPGTP